MQENAVSPRTWKSVTAEVIERLTEFQKTIPPQPHRSSRQRMIQDTVELVIELCEQIEQMEKLEA
jgi:hypothetical protein